MKTLTFAGLAVLALLIVLVTIAKTTAGRIAAASLALLTGCAMFAFVPVAGFLYDLGTGIVQIHAPSTAPVGEPIKIVLGAAVTSHRPIAGRYKNAVLYYRLQGEEGFRFVKPAEQKPIDSKHENFVFIIPGQKAGTLEFFFEYVFDDVVRKQEWKPIAVGSGPERSRT